MFSVNETAVGMPGRWQAADFSGLYHLCGDSEA